MTKMMAKSCCGCCSVRTGTIIIGIMDIAQAIVGALLLVVLYTQQRAVEDDGGQKTVMVASIVNVCLRTFIAGLLLIGVYKRNTVVMLPWVVLTLIGVIGLCLAVLYISIMFFVYHNVAGGFICLVFGLLAIMLQGYLWLVVYTHYQELKDEKRNGQVGMYGKSCNYEEP